MPPCPQIGSVFDIVLTAPQTRCSCLVHNVCSFGPLQLAVKDVKGSTRYKGQDRKIFGLLNAVHWHRVILDEAHMVRRIALVCFALISASGLNRAEYKCARQCQ